jgi:hypothetical protein
MQSKVAYAFNTFLMDLIRDIKCIESEASEENQTTLKDIRSNYKILDKSSVAHIEWFNDQDHENDKDIELLKGCKYTLLAEMFEDQPLDLAALKSYLIVFKILGLVYTDVEAQPESYTSDSLNAVLQKIKVAKSGKGCFGKVVVEDDDEDADDHDDHEVEDVHEILDDRITDLLDELNDACAVQEDSTNSTDNTNSTNGAAETESDMKTFFENSTIGSLAQEISKEINMDDLKGKDPSEILNATFNGGGSGGNQANVLGSVVSKVSAKIHERIASGSLNQEDLMSEAMNLMGMLNTGAAQGMFPADLMANIGSMLGSMDLNPTRTPTKTSSKTLPKRKRH